ncbi:MAG: hypothetical protein H7Z19_07210, partial [Chitinophagaceae bacterium]|nr:hypothetical protein [Rubrivivax sp.]
MVMPVTDCPVGSRHPHLDGGEDLLLLQPLPDPDPGADVAHAPQAPTADAPSNWLQQLPPPVLQPGVVHARANWGEPLAHSALQDLPAPDLSAPAPLAAPESAPAPSVASAPSAPSAASSPPAAELPVTPAWLQQRQAALQALRADHDAARDAALALDQDLARTPGTRWFSQTAFAEQFLAQAVASGNAAWRTLADLYDTDPASLASRHAVLLDLALSEHPVNAGPPPPGRAMGSVQQLGITDLMLADPLMREIAQTFGRIPDAPRTALAWEQVRLYGQARYEQMTRLHIGMESVRDQYSAAVEQASQVDGPGWADVQVERQQAVPGHRGQTTWRTVIVTERQFDPDAFTRWYNTQDGLANRAFAQLYGQSQTAFHAPVQPADEAELQAGPPTVGRITFDDAPWHIDGLGAPMRRDGLIGLDLNTAPRMNNDAAVGFDFEVGWATAPQNIYDKPSSTR